METSVIMKRELFGSEISQNSKNEFLSATDLIKAGNKYRIINSMQPIDLNDWLNQKSTKEFINELEKEFGLVKITARGRGHHTWIHPYLFIDLALSLNPKFKVSVYGWLYDNLLKYRNSSGDSYKKMSGAVLLTLSNKSKFKETIMQIANKIKQICGVEDWQKSSENQLKLRNKIHEYIFMLSDIIRDMDTLVDTAIDKAIKEIESNETKELTKDAVDTTDGMGIIE